MNPPFTQETDLPPGKADRTLLPAHSAIEPMSDVAKYHEHIITVRVLADREIGEISGPNSVAEIMRECHAGDFVGEMIGIESREVTPIHMAELLVAAGSEPGFFSLKDAQELASDLHDSASTEGCTPDLVVVERRAYNALMGAVGLQAYELEEDADTEG